MPSLILQNESMKQSGTILDKVDHHILDELQSDSRLSMRELGRRVGLSAPAVTERVRRLEDAEVILGYGVRVDPKALGRTITAFIGLKDSGRNDPALFRWAEQHQGVMECHSVTGDNSCMLKIAISDVTELEDMLGELINMGFTCDTSIVLSTPIEGKQIAPHLKTE